MKKVTAQEFEVMGNNIEKGKSLLGKSEGKLENLENQKEQLHQEILKLGVEPQNLKQEILNIDELISQKIEEIAKILPVDLIEQNS